MASNTNKRRQACMDYMMYFQDGAIKPDVIKNVGLTMQGPMAVFRDVNGTVVKAIHTGGRSPSDVYEIVAKESVPHDYNIRAYYRRLDGIISDYVLSKVGQSDSWVELAKLRTDMKGEGNEPGQDTGDAQPVVSQPEHPEDDGQPSPES